MIDRLRRLFSAFPRPRLHPAIDQVLLALDRLPHGFCIYDSQDRLVFANEGFCGIYRQRMEYLPFGIPFQEVLRDSTKVGNYPGRTAEDIWRERKLFIDRQERGTFLQSLGDGRLISIFHQPLAGGGWAAVYEDVTERRRAETELRFMAHHDALTMLPNRLFFGEQLDLAVGNLVPGHTCAILFLDLDGFKPVNDRFGHAAGDELLRHLAERLRGDIRSFDVAARLGGDEFAVLMPNVGRQEADEAARRLKRVISAPYALATAAKVLVGVSIGVACAPQDGRTSNDLLASADAALYEAKRQRTLAPVTRYIRLAGSRQA